jgi:hypothetical protein
VTASRRDDDDSEAEDPILRSMRSVWVSMRDEEPSARGLTDLLAAARTKAEQLQPRARDPWWRRSFAVLLRPPVLALATAVVLVGGAVMINRRAPDLDVPVRAPTAESQPLPPSTTATAPAEPPAQRGAGSAAAETATLAPAGRSDLAGDRAADPADPAPERPRTPAAPTGHRTPPRPSPSTNQAIEHSKPELQFGSTSDSKADHAGPGANEAAPGLTIATDEPPAQPGQPRGPAAEPVASPSAASTDSASSVVGGAGAVEQLVKQAEVAAGRGDCPAVRATASRIKKLDATTYKARVEKQAAIARCLK